MQGQRESPELQALRVLVGHLVSLDLRAWVLRGRVAHQDRQVLREVQDHLVLQAQEQLARLDLAAHPAQLELRGQG